MKSGKKIVVAEDDLTSRLVLVAGVEALGCVAIQCSDGERAWQILEDNPDVDLLITDVVMPGLDGRELVKKVRAGDKHSDIPILIISGVVGPKAIANLLDIGVTAFLPKPVSIDELKEYVISNLE